MTKRIFLFSLFLISQNVFAFETFKLNNGLEVIAHRDKRVPLATLVLSFKAGAMTETADINGLTHLWEHMFFKANEKIPSQEAFMKRIRELGITFNGDTSDEMVRYYFTLPSKNFFEGLEFMSYAISSPLLEKTELERERKVVLDEYDRSASSPFFAAYNLNRFLILKDLEYKRTPIGKRPIIEKASKEQLLRIKNEVFVPQNGALIVSGDIPQQDLKKKLDTIFLKWQQPTNWNPVKNSELPFPDKNVSYVMRRPLAHVPQTTWTFRGPTIGQNPADSYPTDALIMLLGHRSGNYYQNFIDSGLTIDSGLGYHTQYYEGQIQVYAKLASKNLETAIQKIPQEILRWKEENYFTESQLMDVKRKMRAEKVFDTNQPSKYALSIAFYWAITGLAYADNYLNNIEKITLKDVRQIVTKYLIDKPFVHSVVLSPEIGEKLGMKDSSLPLIKSTGMDKQYAP